MRRRRAPQASSARPPARPASWRASGCAQSTSTRRHIRACRATPAARPVRSRPFAAAMCFPTARRSAPATTRNGSTRWCSRRANCGATRPTRRSPSRSRRSSPISPRHEPMSGTQDDAVAGLAAALPSLPRDAGGPVFREPWEAEAFAMTLALYRRGVFSWPEWAAALATEIKRAQQEGDPDTGETYYRHWLAALERLVAEKGIADPASLERYRDAWERAADRTPHGTPIELRAEDFR